MNRECVEVGVQCDEELKTQKLEREKAQLQERLEFVEELVGPTEAQRKVLHEQVLAARDAALRAKCRGANVPTKIAGRLDENLLWMCGVSERDACFLQGGCLPDEEGVLQDVSILADPNFKPYDEKTGELRWHARGGILQISLDDIRKHFGDEIAREVARCAMELDKYDASRRIGAELPWHPLENRELQPAEVIDLIDLELSLQSNCAQVESHCLPRLDVAPQTQFSPYVASNSIPRRSRNQPHGPLLARNARGPSTSGAPTVSVRSVVPLPQVYTSRHAPHDVVRSCRHPPLANAAATRPPCAGVHRPSPPALRLPRQSNLPQPQRQRWSPNLALSQTCSGSSLPTPSLPPLCVAAGRHG